MKISMIAATAKNRVIGKNNDMPWGISMPADLKHFKQVTMGKPIIMGRKTFESIGKPLPGRQNIIVSSQPDFFVDSATTVQSPDAAILAASKRGFNEVMIIGGGKIYEHFLPDTNTLYLTEIDLDVTDFDTKFPDYQRYNWQLVESESYPADEKNKYAYRFVTLQRVNSSTQ